MIAEQNGNVTSLIFDTISSDWEQWLFLTSDNHFDSVYCNRELMKIHFDEAKRLNARMFIFGDWYDAMQGRYDPRRSMPELRPEYQRRDNYYDEIVNDSADWLQPYSSNLDVVSDGNHELSVLKAANTNILDRLVKELNKRSNSRIAHGGYGGWIRIVVTENSEPIRTIRIKYFHGSGGEAPVTRGVIQTNRQAVYIPDADIVVDGHSHNYYYVPICRERVSLSGRHRLDIQHHLRIPGYKQSYGDGSTGWEVTRGGVPKPIGSIWVRLYRRDDRVIIQIIPEIDAPLPIGISADELYSGRVFNDDSEGE